MITPALLAISLVAAPAKAPATPKPESAIFAVSGCADCRQAPAVVAGGAPGTFTVQWAALLNFEAFSRTFDVNGNAGSERSLQSPSKAAGVGATAGGSFVLGWERPGEIFAQRLDASGNVTGDSIHVNAGHPGGVDDDDASIAVRSDGVFLAVWDRLRNGAPTELIARRVDPGGAAQPEVVLGQTATRSFPLACFTTSGGSVAAWTHRTELPVGDTPSAAGISLRRTGPDGSPAGEVVEVIAPREVTWDMGLALACAPDGGFVVAWHTRVSPAKSGADIMLQRFNAAGVKIGGLLRVNATVAGEQTGPALLFERDGRLLVAWASQVNGKSEIRGRRLSSKGKPAGR
ncbi:MAG: hypothetical protein ACLGI9_14275, partial [Thermoanaerobaculia bacterium]